MEPDQRSRLTQKCGHLSSVLNAHHLLLRGVHGREKKSAQKRLCALILLLEHICVFLATISPYSFDVI